MHDLIDKRKAQLQWKTICWHLEPRLPILVWKQRQAQKNIKSTLEQHCHLIFKDYMSLLGHLILEPFTICQFSCEGLCKRFFYNVDS